MIIVKLQDIKLIHRNLLHSYTVTMRKQKEEQKDAQHHSLSEKCKSKPQWGTNSGWSEWLLSNSLQAINAGDSAEKKDHSYTVGGNVNWYNPYGRWYGDSLTSNKITIWCCNPTPRYIPWGAGSRPAQGPKRPWESLERGYSLSCHPMIK